MLLKGKHDWDLKLLQSFNLKYGWTVMKPEKRDIQNRRILVRLSLQELRSLRGNRFESQAFPQHFHSLLLISMRTCLLTWKNFQEFHWRARFTTKNEVLLLKMKFYCYLTSAFRVGLVIKLSPRTSVSLKLVILIVSIYLFGWACSLIRTGLLSPF